MAAAPKLDERFGRARHVECRSAKARVDIHQERYVADIGDAADVGQNVVQARYAEIRQPSEPAAHAAADR